MEVDNGTLQRFKYDYHLYRRILMDSLICTMLSYSIFSSLSLKLSSLIKYFKQLYLSRRNLFKIELLKNEIRYFPLSVKWVLSGIKQKY